LIKLPPSRAMMFPVIQEEAGLDKNKAAPAMSDDLEALPRGMLSIKSSNVCLVILVIKKNPQEH